MTLLYDLPPQTEVAKILQRDGVHVLEDVLSPEAVEAIRADAKWFLAQKPQPWLKIDYINEDVHAVISPLHVPRRHRCKLQSLSTLFSDTFFEKTCKKYLGEDVVIDRIIVSKSNVSNKPITMWHADQQNEGRLSFKFMLYLSDSTWESGAFSYVRGSQSLVQDIVRRAALKGVPNTELHTFEQIADATNKFGDADQKQYCESLKKHITGDYESDDHFSIAAKKGSILMFDTKGIHRGGCVREGERLIVRIHCFEPENRGNDGRPLIRRLLSRIKRTLLPKPFAWGFK